VTMEQTGQPTAQQPGSADRDPLIERIVNRAIAACHRELKESGPVQRRAVVIDPVLDAHGRRIFLTDDEVRLSVEIYEALRQLFYRQGFRWTEADPGRAERSAQALGILHATSLLAALGGSDAPRPEAPVGTLAGHRFKAGVRELFRSRAHARWIGRLGVDQLAEDVAALPCPPSSRMAAPVMHVLTSYLAERGGVAAETVVRELVRAGDGGRERAARYAIEGYDPRLWERVQALDETRRNAVVDRVLEPMDRVLRGQSWRRSNAPEPEATPAAIRGAVGIHHAVLELAEAAGMRAAAADGVSLAREKAEYAVHGAYIAWARTSDPGRAEAMAGRIAARATLVAVSAGERGAAAGRTLGAAVSSAGRRAQALAATITRPVATGLEGLQESADATKGARAAVRKRIDDGGFGF
jgi:hypothetical protein